MTHEGLDFDLYETEGRLVVEIALPGVLEPDIDIAFEPLALCVRAERSEASGAWHHRGLPRGSLTSRVPLPGPVEMIEAAFELGILRIELRRIDA